jgi:hypothetical protein
MRLLIVNDRNVNRYLQTFSFLLLKYYRSKSVKHRILNILFLVEFKYHRTWELHNNPDGTHTIIDIE